MGFIADLWWLALRTGGSAGATWRWPSAGTPYEKAAAWSTQPKYQYIAGQLFTYEEHWILLAADVIAAGILMQQHNGADLAPRMDGILASPLGYFEPWHPDTVAALTEEGWKPGGVYTPPFPGMDEFSTYGQVIDEAARRLPVFLRQARDEFPKTTAATVFVNVFADLAQDLILWQSGGVSTSKPVFEPEELIIARMFEYGVLPPEWVEFSLTEDFIQRSMDFATAGGRDLPGPIEMRAAATETWGEYRTE